MDYIKWRPQQNHLTTPVSYIPHFVPEKVVGVDEIAAELAAEHPGSDVEFIKTILNKFPEKIQAHLLGGRQVTIKGAFTFTNAFIGRMDSPDDPLPAGDDTHQVRIYALPPFMRKLRQEAHYEKLAAAVKQPVISLVEDTHLKLPDVLAAGSILKLSGSLLAFAEDDPDCGCVIEGTRSGRAAQQVFGHVSNSSIMLSPEIPAQEDPWNNEYVLSVSTQYTEHGTVRTGFYPRRLRSPLTVQLPPGETGPGILTGNAAAPYVRVIGCAADASERLRIAASLDVHTGILYFNLLDMKERGLAGPAVAVTGNGEYSLSGFAGSAILELTVSVDSFSALVSLVRNGYPSRLVDVLDIRMPV